MPNLRSSRIAPLGLFIGIGLALLVYLTQPSIIQSMVYTTYNPLISPLQLYELAWILATVELLLNFSFPFSLIFWLIVAIVVALLIRDLNVTISTLIAAILLPAGTWLLFIIKYLYLPGFSINFVLTFLFWQTLLPLGITLGLAVLITLPFSLYRRQKPITKQAPTKIQSTCSKCGTTYHSQPLICVQCGEENTIIENQTPEF
ncbi:MAG: hypothetical protein ACXADB_03000 [Candidatus Hermodarchaeia archaeon]|jgi:hypothetical protein